MSWVFALVGLSVPGFSAIGDNGDAATAIVWPSPSVTIMIGAAGSDDIAGDSDLIAIRSALAAWSAPGCTSLRLIDGGLDPVADDGDDGVQRIFFRENNWPAELSGAAAVTIQWENAGSPDTWRGADILLNGDQLAWSTTGEVQKYDVQAVVTHELGHLIGLDHSAELQATMYFVSPRGNTQRRTLHADDVRGVCFLYPASGAASCTEDQECPLMITPNGAHVRLACPSGRCDVGSVGYGGDCLGAVDCAGGICADDPHSAVADDPGACSQACPCPAGDYCWRDRCYRGREDCVLDEDCGAGNNTVCAVDLDGRRRCSRLCLMDSHCQVGVCHGGTGANPPGFCRVPGDGLEGSLCEDGYDCASLTCAGTGVVTTCVGGGVAPGEDAGVPPPLDAGDPPGPTDDAGRPPDRDAGPSLADAATPLPDGGSAVDPAPLEGTGCGCSSTTSHSSVGVFALMIAAFVLRQIGAGRGARKTR